MDVHATQEELTSSLALHGWQVTSNKPAGGQWKATGKNQHGETIERVGNTPEMALNALLQFAMRHNQIRSLAPTYAKSVSPNISRDPNHDWDGLGIDQLVAPVKAGDANDYIGISEATRNAAKVDTEWWEEPEDRQRLAIMNAFRVALLSPRKHLRWNAAHYQALMHHDPSTPAIDLWHSLEEARVNHNSRLGYPEDSHLSYKRELEMLTDEIMGTTPSLQPHAARKRAKEIIFEKTKQFEEQLYQDPKNEKLSELRRYNMARKMVADWLVQNYSRGKGWQPGQSTMLGAVEDFDWDVAEKFMKPEPRFEIGDEVVVGDQRDPIVMFVAGSRFSEYDREWEYDLRKPGVSHTIMYPERMIRNSYTFDQPWIPPENLEWHKEGAEQESLFTPEAQPESTPDAVQDMSGFSAADSKYGAFMGGHLDAIAEVGQHIEDIRQAALKDLEEDGGKGFVFRNAVMNMNLKGVNPKVASFAWLLLSPLSSDLGIVDTHILRGLGYNTPNIPVRDYYKIERMEKAAKDASGYQHVPLGLYHWGLWDHIRNPGSHSDHSPLRVLDPQPWDDDAINWDAATTMKAGPFTGHHAFEATRPIMDSVARDFDYTFHEEPKNQVPDPANARKRQPDGMAHPLTVPQPAL